MANTVAGAEQAGTNSTSASTFDLNSAIQQQQMFQQSMQVNMAQSELQTWGNLAESIAKAKPQV